MGWMKTESKECAPCWDKTSAQFVVWLDRIPREQNLLSLVDSVPHMGNEHGLKEDDWKEGAIRSGLYTVGVIGEQNLRGTESLVTPAAPSELYVSRSGQFFSLFTPELD